MDRVTQGQARNPIRDGVVGHVLVLAIYLAAYYVLSYPALHDMGSRLLTSGGDGLQNYWNNWWVRDAVARCRFAELGETGKFLAPSGGHRSGEVWPEVAKERRL